MCTKIVLVLCLLAAVALAIPTQTAGGWPGAGGWAGSGAVNPWIPPWMAAAPWYPQWTPCTTIGASCLDCNTRLVCTKIGGLQRSCTDPAMPYCNLGECSATPSAECAPAETAPAKTA